MAGARILVVEDEPRLAGVLRDYLRSAGHHIELVDDGAQVIAAVRRFRPDLILLDLMLPNRDGLAICRELRTAGDPVAIIMVTARVEEVDRLLGLETGADDYICKPYSPREVVARVTAVLRRVRQPERPADWLYIDETGGRAALRGTWLDLTPVEFRLLRTLAASPGRMWSREQLMDHLYTDHRIVTDRTVDSHVRNLRRKLTEAGADPDPIHSIYGMGYRFEP